MAGNIAERGGDERGRKGKCGLSQSREDLNRGQEVFLGFNASTASRVWRLSKANIQQLSVPGCRTTPFMLYGSGWTL